MDRVLIAGELVVGQLATTLRNVTLFEGLYAERQWFVPQGSMILCLGQREGCVEFLWEGRVLYLLTACHRIFDDVFGLVGGVPSDGSW